MAFSLPLSPPWTQARWKVKIFDKENREPPHVTIVRGLQKWRVNLRTGAFMDRYPPPRYVDDAVVQALHDHGALLQEQWDQICPHNPVEGTDDEPAPA